jgi:hypothetical protein
VTISGLDPLDPIGSIIDDFEKRVQKKLAMNARKAAMLANERVYEGVPCELGHTIRFTSNSQCRECNKLMSRVYYDNIRESRGEKRRYKKNGEYKKGCQPKPAQLGCESDLSRDLLERLNSRALKYVGLKCQWGHSGLRYTRNDKCVECMTERNKSNRPPLGLSKSERLAWIRNQRIERKNEKVRLKLQQPKVQSVRVNKEIALLRSICLLS